MKSSSTTPGALVVSGPLGVPPAIRSPLDCVQTAIANLQMAADASVSNAAKAAGDPYWSRYASGQASAFAEAITLIRSEFQGYLP